MSKMRSYMSNYLHEEGSPWWDMPVERGPWSVEVTKKAITLRHGQYIDANPRTPYNYQGNETLLDVPGIIAKAFEVPDPAAYLDQVVWHGLAEIRSAIFTGLAANQNTTPKLLQLCITYGDRSAYRAMFHNPVFPLLLIECLTFFEDMTAFKVALLADRCFKPGDLTPWYYISKPVLEAMARAVMCADQGWAREPVASVGYCWGLWHGLSIPKPKPSQRVDHLRHGLYLCHLASRGIAPRALGL